MDVECNDSICGLSAGSNNHAMCLVSCALRAKKNFSFISRKPAKVITPLKWDWSLTANYFFLLSIVHESNDNWWIFTRVLIDAQWAFCRTATLIRTPSEFSSVWTRTFWRLKNVWFVDKACGLNNNSNRYVCTTMPANYKFCWKK